MIYTSTPILIGAALALLFLCWHEPWFVQKLKPEEVDAAFDGPLRDAHITPQDRATLRAFFAKDDGRAFYNLNLEKFHKVALYPVDAPHPEVKTGRQANARYGAAVLPLLLKRASYPVFVARKIANMLCTDEGLDYFEEVAIVRYRSRRDMLSMILDPAYAAAYPHKFASLAQNVATPTRSMIAVNAAFIVPVVVMLGALLASHLLIG